MEKSKHEGTIRLYEGDMQSYAIPVKDPENFQKAVRPKMELINAPIPSPYVTIGKCYRVKEYAQTRYEFIDDKGLASCLEKSCFPVTATCKE